MTDNNQIDTFFDEDPDLMQAAHIQTTLPIHPPKKEFSFGKKDDFLKPSYMLKYDSISGKYSLDSVAAKNFTLKRTFSLKVSDNHLPLDLLPISLKGYDGIFISLLLCFLILSKVIQNGSRFFLEGLRMLVTFREKKDTLSEITINEFWSNLFLIILPSFLLSLVMYQFLQTNDVSSHSSYHTLFTLLGTTLFITLFIALKYLLYVVIGFVFDMKEFTSNFLRHYLSLIELFGVLIFVPTLLYLYQREIHQFLLSIIVILFVLMQIMQFYRIINFFLRKRLNFLFVIAYLCSVEIIPYLIVIYGYVYMYKQDIFCLL